MHVQILLMYCSYGMTILLHRWIAGITVNNSASSKNLHNHKIHSPNAISTFVKESIVSAVTASPRLTADDLAARRGLQFIPGAVDNAATNKDKIRGIRKKALEHFGHQKGINVYYYYIASYYATHISKM